MSVAIAKTATVQAVSPNANAELADMAKLIAQMEELKAQLAIAQKAAMSGPRQVSFKLAEKGGISVYGLQKFPVTLYRESWLKLLDAKDALMTFVEANKTALDATYQAHVATKK